MEHTKKPRRMSRARVIEIVTGMLTAALEQSEDCIVTYETYPDTGKTDLHVLVGQLISPCMLGTLKKQGRDPRRRRQQTVDSRVAMSPMPVPDHCHCG